MRERERARYTHTSKSETQMKRKRKRNSKNPEERACYTVVLQQTLDLILCLSKIESDITRICAGRWGPAQLYGRERKGESGVGVGGENKRVRGPVTEWENERARKRKGEWETGRKKESLRETHLGAQKTPAMREGESQRKNYGEREIEGYWDQNDRDRVRKKEKGTESTMWHVLYT